MAAAAQSGSGLVEQDFKDSKVKVGRSTWSGGPKISMWSAISELGSAPINVKSSSSSLA